MREFGTRAYLRNLPAFFVRFSSVLGWRSLCQSGMSFVRTKKVEGVLRGQQGEAVVPQSHFLRSPIFAGWIPFTQVAPKGCGRC